ncbi:hypothetical protein BX666DRAFT_1844237, partial [Dichotomocladium elegans]
EGTSRDKSAQLVDIGSSDPRLTDYPREVTWLFFRDNQWIPFQGENHYKIEQAFTMG